MKVVFSVSTGMVGSRIEEVAELDDDLNDEEIEEQYQEWMWGKIDAFWRKEETDTKEGRSNG